MALSMDRRLLGLIVVLILAWAGLMVRCFG